MALPKIQTGKLKVIDKDKWLAMNDRREKFLVDEVWEGAKRAAAEKEKLYGDGNLGPWTDFEWGMLNGKLSALRWALGDDWDMLDT